MAEGQIYKIHSDLYYVRDGNEKFPCKIREVLKKSRTEIVTGDYVEYEQGVISRVLPRKTYIKRPSVANIDQILIVSALKQPELDFHQLNRYIAIAKYYNIPAVLCFNKEDLSHESSVNDKIISIYSPLGYKIIFTSALKKDGIQDLYNLLKGKTTALCGNSGVGKSSIVNSLNPLLNLRTQSVSDKTQRGTHTTRHCEIMCIDENTNIVDTPGFSNIKFDFIMPKDVSFLFEEINEYKRGCKFADCLHISESGCEVLKNIDKIDPSRYEIYLELVQEAFEYKEKITYNGIKKESASKRNNNRDIPKISEKRRLKSRNNQKQMVYKEFEDNENEF